MEQGFAFEMDPDWPDHYIPLRTHSIYEMDLIWPDVYISVCPQYVKRVLDNVTSNLIKYADANEPIRIAVAENGAEVGIIFQNTVKNIPLRQESTHIGIININTMMKKMHGVCEVSETEGIFRTSLWFSIFRK